MSAAKGATPPETEKTLVISVPGGRRVKLEHDLDFGAISTIATKYEVSWLAVVSQPLLIPSGALLDLYRACCAVAGVAPPELLSAKAMYDAIESVECDLPAVYDEDGAPKAATATT